MAVTKYNITKFIKNDPVALNNIYPGMFVFWVSSYNHLLIKQSKNDQKQKLINEMLLTKNYYEHNFEFIISVELQKNNKFKIMSQLMHNNNINIIEKSPTSLFAFIL